MRPEDRKFISIQSKVSAATAEKIDRIVEKGGFESRYEFMQYLLSSFLRYADMGEENKDEQTEELKEFAKMFEGWENKKNRVITTKPSGNRALRLVDSINIYSEIGRKGYVCKHIALIGDNVRTSSNIATALELVIKKLHPGIANQLQTIGCNIGEQSYMRVIEYMLDSVDIERVNEVKETFRANDGSITYGVVPKKKRSKSLNDE